MNNASLITKTVCSHAFHFRHDNWNLKENSHAVRNVIMSISIRNHVYCCCFQWEGFLYFPPPPFFFFPFLFFIFFFSDIGFFFSCSSKAISLCLWTGNLFPWKWMGCHKHSAMTSLQAQGEDGSKRGISDYFRLLWLPTVNPNGQIMERRERVGLNRDIGVTWVGDEGCDDYSLWDVSFCERKAIDLLLFVS